MIFYCVLQCLRSRPPILCESSAPDTPRATISCESGATERPRATISCESDALERPRATISCESGAPDMNLDCKFTRSGSERLARTEPHRNHCPLLQYQHRKNPSVQALFGEKALENPGKLWEALVGSSGLLGFCDRKSVIFYCVLQRLRSRPPILRESGAPDAPRATILWESGALERPRATISCESGAPERPRATISCESGAPDIYFDCKFTRSGSERLAQTESRRNHSFLLPTP